jgi:hypothetical protein
VLSESTQSLLLCKLELLDLQPFGNRHSSFCRWRRIAEPRTSSGKIVFEFLSFFAEHVKNCIPSAIMRCLIDLTTIAS